MAKNLDIQYLADLVERIQAGNLNSFGELYLATFTKQYTFCYYQLQDEELAKQALEDVYTQALKRINQLKQPMLITVWLNRISFQVCAQLRPVQEYLVIRKRRFELPDLYRLPLTESQILIMSGLLHMHLKDVCYTLDLNPKTVRMYIDSGKERLLKSHKINRL